MAPLHLTGQVLGVILVMTTKGRLNALVCLSVSKDFLCKLLSTNVHRKLLIFFSKRFS